MVALKEGNINDDRLFLKVETKTILLNEKVKSEGSKVGYWYGVNLAPQI